VRTTDPEVRKNLPVPYEYLLHHECQRRDTLPFEGGLLDQPHILLLSFRLIDDENAQAEAERRRLEEINRQQVEMFKKAKANQN
jgi:hypothetical protein